MLHRLSTCCTVLQHVAPSVSMLHRLASCCMLHRLASCCTVCQHVASSVNMLHRLASCCNGRYGAAIDRCVRIPFLSLIPIEGLNAPMCKGTLGTHVQGYSGYPQGYSGYPMCKGTLGTPCARVLWVPTFSGAIGGACHRSDGVCCNKSIAAVRRGGVATYNGLGALCCNMFGVVCNSRRCGCVATAPSASP